MWKLKFKRFLLRLTSFACSVGPIGAVLYLNWDRYVRTVSDAVKLSAGAIILIIFVVLKVLGKLRVPRRVTVYAIVLGLSYLFATVLVDLMLISGAALVGEAVDLILISPAIKRVSEKILVEKSADATASRVEELLKSYIGGRV